MTEQQVWRKSSYSGVNNYCVEVADLPALLAVRDSKHLRLVCCASPPLSGWRSSVWHKKSATRGGTWAYISLLNRIERSGYTQLSVRLGGWVARHR